MLKVRIEVKKNIVFFAHTCGQNIAADCFRGDRKHMPLALTEKDADASWIGPEKYAKHYVFFKNICVFFYVEWCGIIE